MFFNVYEGPSGQGLDMAAAVPPTSSGYVVRQGDCPQRGSLRPTGDICSGEWVAAVVQISVFRTEHVEQVLAC